MKRTKKIGAAVTVLLIFAMSVTTVFADIDYSQWDSGVKGYPKDVAGTALFAQAQDFFDNKVITGDTDGLFHPDRTLKRSEFAAILARATANQGQITTSGKENYFNDLKGYGWAKAYINFCSEKGLMEGTGGNKFNPGGVITYQEAMTAIIRSKGISETVMSSYGTWPNNYIKYASMYNMNGTVKVTNWAAPITKGEVVQFMYKNMPK